MRLREFRQERPGGQIAVAMVQGPDDRRIGDGPGARRHAMTDHVDEDDSVAAGLRQMQDEISAAGRRGSRRYRHPISVHDRRQLAGEETVEMTGKPLGETGLPDGRA